MIQKSKTSFFHFLNEDLKRVINAKQGLSEKKTAIAVQYFSEFLSPRFWPVVLFRASQFFSSYKMEILGKLVSLVNLILFGIEIPAKCKIAGGILFPHTMGTVIGAYEIAENVTIFQGVTIGALELDYSYTPNLRPTIGAWVVIGAGAKVLGGIHIGEHSVIGANAVVLTDVPPHSIAVGVPAVIKNRFK